MKKHPPLLALLALAITAQLLTQTARAADPRDFAGGRLIPDESYCDQPYIVITKNGDWLCTMTTGPGKESAPGQHAVATISSDQGRTWSPLIDIEPSGKLESSWVIPVMAPGGRIYAFYNYNGDDIRTIGMPGAPGAKPINVPTLLGWYVYKFSDDCGRTWSKERHRLPMPVAPIDLGNEWGGKVQMFWGIDKPMIANGALWFAFTRLGTHHPRFPRAPAERPANDDWRRLAVSEKGEGWLYKSSDILTETDPAKIKWELLPEGDRGIRRDDYDPIQQEHNLADLPDGGICCIFRTVHGFVASSYSRDGGRAWTKPEPATYAASGAPLKNSIACAAIWRTQTGGYLLWYHNNDDMRRGGTGPLQVTSRNTSWLAAGSLRDGKLVWSQPELVCYQDRTTRGQSYPDLIEEGGKYFISATNKSEARILELDTELVRDLLNQDNIRTPATRNLALAAGANELRHTAPPPRMPRLPDLKNGGGFTIELWLTARGLKPGQILFDTTTQTGKGIRIETGAHDNLQIRLSDGEKQFTWESDHDQLKPGRRHQVAFIVDGGPGMISAVVDGQLCDGGPSRAYGFGRLRQQSKLAADIADANGTPAARIAQTFDGELSLLRIYDRALRVTELIGNHRAGAEPKASSK